MRYRAALRPLEPQIGPTHYGCGLSWDKSQPSAGLVLARIDIATTRSGRDAAR
jgi:hypothetical protein